MINTPASSTETVVIHPPGFSAPMAPGMVELHPPGLLQNIVLLFLLSLPFIIVITIIGVLIKIVISKSSHVYKKRIAGFCLIAIFSVAIVLYTLHLPKTAYSPNDLINITCGWPYPFIEFTSWRNPPDGWTEDCIGWLGNPMEYQKMIFWQPFILNVMIVFGFSTIVFYLIKFIYKNVVDLKKE